MQHLSLIALAAAVLFGSVRPLLAQTAVVQDNAGNQETWDKDGLAFRANQRGTPTYSRDLQALQRRMNQEKVQGAPAIPETGRYNYEMFGYSHAKLKAQADQLAKGTRLDRTVGLAELLDKQFKEWAYSDPNVEQDLIRAGKAKAVGNSNVYLVVEERLARRKAALARAQEGIQRYEAEANRLKSLPVITEAQAGSMALSETAVMRWLSIGVLEAQAYHADNLKNRLDPAYPDAMVFRKAVDAAKATAAQKARWKEQAVALRGRVDQLRSLMDKTRQTLTKEANSETAQAALSATTQELRGAAGDYERMMDAIVAAQR